jgi:hypothetical protein
VSLFFLHKELDFRIFRLKDGVTIPYSGESTGNMLHNPHLLTESRLDLCETAVAFYFIFAHAKNCSTFYQPLPITPY